MRSAVPIALAASLAISGPVRAYEIDTHYHLRFALAMSTCFDWHKAHLIASGVLSIVLGLAIFTN